MNHKHFADLLAKRLHPILREAGFKGSGSTLRRVSVPVVHVFNVQASSSGSRCFVNLGVHLTFLPPEGGQVVEPADLTESHCAFRQRLGEDWAYGSTDEQAEASINQLVKAWQEGGASYFDRYSGFPESFFALVHEANANQINPKQGLTLARIALEIGSRARAAELAEASLSRSPAMASGLRFSLKQVLQQASRVL